MNTQLVYLDHSASTPLDPRVLDAMLPYFSEHYGNSLAVHSFGRQAERAVEDARDTVARVMNCHRHEIVFTSGGTESDNLALRGPVQYALTQGQPITLITTPVEHKAVAVTARQLRDTAGAALRVVPVDEHGRVSADDLRAALQNLPSGGLALVSLIHSNNEIGTRNPIPELAAIAHEYGAIVHTDAVQAPGHGPLDVSALDVDLLSLSSHKFYGPKGAGVLVVRNGIDFLTSHSGAKHEDYRRGGTHNVPGIVGTAAALELAMNTWPETAPRLAALRDRLVEGIMDRVPDTRLTGHPADRLPGHASFAFAHLDGNTLLMLLDQSGIAASSGSACKVGDPRPSPVLEAIGLGPEWTRGGLRLTLGHSTTGADISAVLDVLPKKIRAARQMPPSISV
ncbi:MAG: aminotransferase class V-fold PLP-dependent enzyme [Anaerolineae bacterium]|nr:aminotransferase class V-fold PLP-dependent enzyme [Anaerolineae bacterium]